MNTYDTSAPTRIRPATAADAPRLARLRWEFRVAAYGRPEEGEDAFVARCLQWMRERLGDSRGSWHVWVAEREDDGELTGQIWLQLIEKLPNPSDEPEWHAYISNLYVRPSARGGLGTQLLQRCLDWLAKAPHDRTIHDIVLWPSPQSRSLYERHGFTVRDDVLVRRGTRESDPGH
jgi:RimJ/RimL family protein N-acetyltransferase